MFAAVAPASLIMIFALAAARLIRHTSKRTASAILRAASVLLMMAGVVGPVAAAPSIETGYRIDATWTGAHTVTGSFYFETVSGNQAVLTHWEIMAEGISYTPSNTNVYDPMTLTLSAGWETSPTPISSLNVAMEDYSRNWFAASGQSVNNGAGQTSTLSNATLTRLGSQRQLSSLAFSQGVLAPAFDGGTRAYTLTLPSGTTTVSVSATQANSTDTMTLSDSYSNYGSWDGTSRTLSAPGNTISISLYDGSQTSSYSIEIVTALSTDANLAWLSLSSGTLAPTFSSSQTSYSASVGNAVGSISVTPTVSDAGASLMVNGVAVASGTASSSISLSVGENPIDIRVTAEDGVTIRTYTVNVTRALSSDAALSALSLSEGSISFQASTHAYETDVANAIETISVTPTTSSPEATLTVNGVAAASGSSSTAIPLSVGANIITVKVTAQDGTAVETYTITVNRAASSDADLASLSLSSGTLAPTFIASQTSYSVSVGSVVDAISVTPTASGSDATLTVNGVAVTSGSASTAIPLSVGANTIAIQATAQDGTTVKTYTLTITRAASSDASLAALVLSEGMISFQASTHAYETDVAHAVEMISVTPTASSADATIKVNGVGVASGESSAAIPLLVGANTITVKVTAQDGTTVETYTLTVNRAASSDADLASLSLSSGTLAPTFIASQTSYSVSVGNVVDAISVTPTASGSDATLTVNGVAVTSGSASAAIPLSVGANTIAIQATAQDGTTVKTYTITVDRAPSADASLSALSLSEGSISFQASTHAYDTDVANAIETISVTPTTSSPEATLTVNGAAAASGSSSTAIPLSVGANVITVKVTAQDGTTVETYTLTVNRAPSANASLTNLSVSSGALSFSAATHAYRVEVANDVTEISLTATAAHPAATIKLADQEIASGVASSPITLLVGETTLVVTVLAQDGQSEASYTVAVVRAPSSDASIGSIALSQGQMTFDPSIHTYLLQVNNDVEEIVVTPTANSSTTTLTVNGIAVASGTESEPVAIELGLNVITVTATAQDGSTVETYTLKVTRVPSSDATLTALSISEGDLAFDPGVRSYHVTVGNEIEQVTLTPVAAHENSKITVSAIPTASGSASGPQQLRVGETTISVEVRAEDDFTVVSYQVTIYREPSRDATIDAVQFSAGGGELVPAFTPAVTNYTMSVGNPVSAFTVQAFPANPNARVEVSVNGHVVGGTGPMPSTPVMSFAAASLAPASVMAAPAAPAPAPAEDIEVPLEVGENVILINVVAEDASTTQSYTIVVTRAASADAGLSSLLSTEGNLSPGFSTEVTSYALHVQNDVESVSFTPTARHAEARIIVNGQSVDSGANSAAIALSVGENPIIIEVTAEDGETKMIYSLTATRASSPSYEFAQHEEEIREIVREQARTGTRARLVASENFSRQTRDRFIDRKRAEAEGTVARNARPFSWSGTFKATNDGVTAQGEFSAERQWGEWTRLAYSEIDLWSDADGSTVGSISARLAQERMVSSTAMIGFYLGADVAKGEIDGSFTGESLSYDVSVGAYGVKQLGEALWIDGFASIGTGLNHLALDNGTLKLDGDYGTRTFLVGAAITGSKQYDAFELRPQISVSHGTTWIGEVPFDASAFGTTEAVSLEAGKVQVTRLQARPEFLVPLPGGLGDTEGRVAPSLICEWTDLGGAASCGGGLELGLSTRSDDGMTDVGASVVHERVGDYKRLSIGLNLIHRF